MVFEERVKLMELMVTLRQTAPMGIVGLLETRNLLADLFPEFAEVRDSELDDLIRRYAESLAADPPAYEESESTQ